MPASKQQSVRVDKDDIDAVFEAYVTAVERMADDPDCILTEIEVGAVRGFVGRGTTVGWIKHEDPRDCGAELDPVLISVDGEWLGAAGGAQ